MCLGGLSMALNAGGQRHKCFISGWGEGRATLGMGILEGRLYMLLE